MLAACLAACDDGHLDTFAALGQEASGAGGADAGDAAVSSDAEPDAGAGTAGQNGDEADSGIPSRALLDDFEDGDTQGASDSWWYTQDDATAPDPEFRIQPPPDRPESAFALRVTGGGFTDWGAFVGLDLPGAIFDVSPFDELVLWARVDAPETLLVSVEFLDANAFDHFGVEIELDGEWREYTLPLSEFVFTEDDASVAFNPANVSHLQIFLRDAESDFDLWLDDVELLRTR